MARVARKVCILGDFAVGKTSTVARFVNNVFSEKYLTTVGVKIDTKDVVLPGGDTLRMVIWDIAGGKRFSSAEFSYLRGAQAYLLVADGTRPETLDNALALHQAVEERYGRLPFALLVNKNDLAEDWEIPRERLDALRDSGMQVLCTSAKTGDCVDRAFDALAQALAGAQQAS